jgi:type I restriction enzyme S subunit
MKGQSLQSKDFIMGSVPVIAGGQSYAGYHNRYNHDKTCVTISASGAYAGYVWLHEYPIFASDCSVIEGNENVDIYFLYNILKMKQEIIYQSQTGGAQPHIHPKDIAPIRIDIPSIEEQKAIALILIDMDKEIVTLETKKIKYEAIKQGMMQELLTGKIRLV